METIELNGVKYKLTKIEEEETYDTDELGWADEYGIFLDNAYEIFKDQGWTYGYNKETPTKEEMMSIINRLVNNLKDTTCDSYGSGRFEVSETVGELQGYYEIKFIADEITLPKSFFNN